MLISYVNIQIINISTCDSFITWKIYTFFTKSTYIFYTYSTPQFGLATFQVFSSLGLLLATPPENTGMKHRKTILFKEEDNFL